jgi:isopentenyl diphosphate isomerase/L-lactate dehydrogenase-like FMN-dependent dehydrogenase
MPPLARKKTGSRLPLASLADLEAAAREKITAGIFDYIDCGACDGITRTLNRSDLEKLRLLPFCLNDVSEPKLSSTFFGQNFSAPFGFSPTALHRMVHEDGEVAAASAAKTLNVPMIVSCMSSVSLEDIVSASGNAQLWFQIYLFKDRALTLDLVKRAERVGYKAIVLTVGCPVTGKRDRNIRNRFSLPRRVTAANFRRRDVVDHNNPIHSFHGAELDPSLTWRDVEWLRARIQLPLVLKGVMNPRDVAPALELQVSGLVVSNHGGRQLDTTESTIRMLPEIAAQVARRVPLFIDGGFRRGTDLIKAFALGADGVLLGRPVMWALACGGESAVAGAVNLLAEELRTAMQLIGCPGIDALRRESGYIVRS